MSFHCKSPSCNCPEYEHGSEGVCDLCEHMYQWHLSPVRLTAYDAEEMKARGQVAVEFCKATIAGLPCPCPNFLLSENGGNCFLCNCKMGWHKYKSNNLDGGNNLKNQQQSFSYVPPVPSVSYPQYSQPQQSDQFQQQQHQTYQQHSQQPPYHQEQYLPPISIPSSSHNTGGSQGSSLGQQSNSSWSGMSTTSPQDANTPISFQQYSSNSYLQQSVFASMPPKTMEQQYHWGASPPIANFPQSHYFGTSHTIPRSNQQPVVLEETEENIGLYNERLTPEENKRRKGKERQASTTSNSSGSPAISRDPDTFSVSEQDAPEDPEFFLTQRAQPPSAPRIRPPRGGATITNGGGLPLTLTPGHLLGAEREWRHSREGSNGGSSNSNESPTTKSPPPSPLTVRTPPIGSLPVRTSFPQAYLSNPQQPPPTPPIPQFQPQHSQQFQQQPLQFQQQPLQQYDQRNLVYQSQQNPYPPPMQPRDPRPHAYTISYAAPSVSSSSPRLVQHAHSMPTPPRSTSSGYSIDDIVSATAEVSIERTYTPAPLQSTAATANGRELSRMASSSSATSEVSQASRSSVISGIVGFGEATGSSNGEVRRTSLGTVPQKIVPDPIPVHTPTAATSSRPQFELHESKNMTLSISPPLATRKYKPGQVFSFKLDLGPKVSLSSYEKIEVRLVGCGFVYGEPPDSHDFMSVKSSILPISYDVVAVGNANRSFSWSMTLPLDQTCDCRDRPHSIPASFAHPSFKTEYRVELLAKKTGRFSIGGPEKLEIPFYVDSLFVEDPQLVTPLPTTLTRGIDGPWSTMRLSQITIMENTSAKIVSSELAWQLLPSVDILTTKILYRFTLNFGQLPPSEYLDLTVLDKIAETLRVSVSRRVVLTKAGKKGGKETPLPALRVTLKEYKGHGIRTMVNGITLWRFEGYFEIPNSELKSVLVCNVNVRYSISAHVPARGGLSTPIDIIARNLKLELPRQLQPSPSTVNNQNAPNGHSESPQLPLSNVMNQNSDTGSEVLQLDDQNSRSNTSASNYSTRSEVGSVGRRGSRLDLPPDFDDFEPEDAEAPPPFHDAVQPGGLEDDG